MNNLLILSITINNDRMVKKDNLFIVFEGIDGSGTTSQTIKTVKWLEENFEVVKTKEPTDSSIGKVITNSLSNDNNEKLPPQAEALLFAGDRVLHLNDTVIPALDDGKIVVSDRYFYSSFAYQQARGLPLSWIQSINQMGLRVIPDITFILDVPPEKCFDRMSSGKDMDEFDKDIQLQEKVRENYKALAGSRPEVELINGDQSIEDVQKIIKDKIKEYLPKV